MSAVLGFLPEATGLGFPPLEHFVAFQKVQEVSSVINVQISNSISEFLVQFLATAQVSGYLKQQLLTPSKPTSEDGAVW